MDTVLFTWFQALQLVALGPCLFIIFFLCVTARNIRKIVVPALYFLSLSCSFLLPIAHILGFDAHVEGALVMGKSLIAALSFLLIIEFITGSMPPPAYWTILAIPLLGGSSIIYVSLITKGEICVYENICTSPDVFKQLYEIFSASLIFLLTITVYSRLSRTTEDNLQQKQQKYAIIIALIMLNLAVLVLKLLYVSGHIEIERAELAAAIIRIGFIYLTLTFIFRIFDRSFDIAYERVPTVVHEDVLTDRDIALAENIRKILAEEKLYRAMELSREMLAKKLAVTENQLSRVINKFFLQNFNTLINSYRVDEAKARLEKEKTPVTAIAFEVGFNSIPSFNRVFKQVTGLSPSEYRNQSVPTQSLP